MTIGVLALQGAFREHAAVLGRLGVPVREVRRKEDLQGIRGIVLPGGESTVQGKLLRDSGDGNLCRTYSSGPGNRHGR